MRQAFEQSNLPFKLNPAMVKYLSKVINTISGEESSAVITMMPEPIHGQPWYEFEVSLHQPFDGNWLLFKLEVRTIDQGSQEVTLIGRISRFSGWRVVDDDSAKVAESGQHLLGLWQSCVLQDITSYPDAFTVNIEKDGKEVMTVPLTI